MKKVGLLGCGRIGQVHAASIEVSDKLTLAAVYDVVAERAEQTARRYGCAVAASAEYIIAASEIDGVVIASATDTHTDLMLKAAAAGKPMYAEKPIDRELARAQATAACLKHVTTPIQVGFHRRFDQDIRALQTAVASGEVGALQTLLMTSRGPNSTPPLVYLQVSGGIYRDKCVHFFGLARWIVGEEPLDIVALGTVVDDPFYASVDDVDTAAIVLRFPSGAICQIDNARRAAHGYDDRFEAFGTKGLVEAGRARTGNIIRAGAESYAADGLIGDPFVRYRDAFRASIDAFGRVLHDPSTPVPTLADGIAAQRIAEAATISAAERRIVALNEIPAGSV